MDGLKYLTTAVFAAWCASELAISGISLRNRWRGQWEGSDRLSYWAVWLALMVPLVLAVLIWRRALGLPGVGSMAALAPLLALVGDAAIAGGIAIRLAAVVTLNKQFTTMVAIAEHHELIEAGLYRRVRHPAYLGLLLSLLGLGLVSGNWISLAALTALPLAAILYRIHVEEQALTRRFGAAYTAYARRTRRLLPGIY